MSGEQAELRIQRFLTKAAQSLIPPVDLAAHFYADVIKPKLATRGYAFLQLCLDEIFAVEAERIAAVEAVIESPEFAAFAYQAAEQASLTQSEEKLKALRNAVINLAIGSDPGEDRRLIFLRAVSELTPTHLRMLRILQDPCGFVEESGVETSPSPPLMEQVLQIAFPDFSQNQDFYKLLHGDLGRRGFVPERVDMGTFKIQGDRITTPLGDEFLSFICSQADDG